MPIKSAQDDFDFLTKYQQYQSACQYAKSWLSGIAAIAQDLQSSPQFAISLSPSEQSDVQSNASAASGVLIKTVSDNTPQPGPVIK